MPDRANHHTSWLQQWLENIWYQNSKGRFLLLPLSTLYCAINRMQRYWQTRQQPKLPCPVVVIGNITLGGTGKTPLSIYIVNLLKQEGFKPAIITRGYAGKAKHWPQLVTAKSEATQVGDEAVLMANRTGVPVYAGADRLSAIRALLEAQDCDVIISDDGLQHYKLPRNIQIAVIDGMRMLGNGLCLPSGPLREKKNRLNDCDFVFLNKSHSDGERAATQVDESWLNMSLEGDQLFNLKTNRSIDLTQFSGKTVNAVTGIGNPQRFYQTLEQAGLRLQKHSFPDHHDFGRDDLEFDNNHPIIMTEKDAVKCRLFATDKHWYLPVTAKLDKRFKDRFLTMLER